MLIRGRSKVPVGLGEFGIFVLWGEYWFVPDGGIAYTPGSSFQSSLDRAQTAGLITVNPNLSFQPYGFITIKMVQMVTDLSFLQYDGGTDQHIPLPPGTIRPTITKERWLRLTNMTANSLIVYVAGLSANF